MAQKPLKKFKIDKKPTKYKRLSKKFRDEESQIRKKISKDTVQMLEAQFKNIK